MMPLKIVNKAITTQTPFSVASLSERYFSDLLKKFGCWQNISSKSILKK